MLLDDIINQLEIWWAGDRKAKQRFKQSARMFEGIKLCLIGS